jgi:hypothetical protein
MPGKIYGPVEFSEGIVLGDTLDEVAGKIRWNGSHFQGYTGVSWMNMDEGGGTVTGSSTGAGEIPFWDTASSIGSNAAFYWNDTDQRLTIGPAYASTEIGPVLYINPTWTADSGGEADSRFGIRIRANHDGADCSGDFTGEQIWVRWTSAWDNVKVVNFVHGLDVMSEATYMHSFYGGVTGINCWATHTEGGSAPYVAIPILAGIRVGTSCGTGLATNNYGIYVAGAYNGLNNYSIYIDDGYSANNYAIYTVGSPKARFGGNLITAGNMLPEVDDAQDLGDSFASLRWKSLHLGSGGIKALGQPTYSPSGSVQWSDFPVVYSTAVSDAIDTFSIRPIYANTTGTIDRGTGVLVGSTKMEAGTLTLMEGIRVQCTRTGGTVTTMSNIVVYPDSTAATTKHGLKIWDMTGATNNYAIQTGLGQVYFGDVVICNRTIQVGAVSGTAVAGMIQWDGTHFYGCTVGGGSPTWKQLDN